MNKAFLLLLALLILALSGCTQQNNPEICAQVITPATSPEGECTEYPTPCDVPKGYTLVDSCESDGQIIGGDKDENGCLIAAGYSWCEIKQKCLREWEEPCSPGPEPMCAGGYEPGDSWKVECNTCNCQADGSVACTEIACNPESEKYDFSAELKFCEFEGVSKKYTIFYQIRNNTDNPPTYGAKIWLKVPDYNDFAQPRTIQDKYTNGQILWEEQLIDHLSEGRIRGQYWEIRNLDYNRSLDYELIYCESEVTAAECTRATGILVAQGNTAELCSFPGS
ncbi:MAG: hypothetical protein NUV67_01300 [archaeon]|nr:hypothetical protein [archaeon]